MDQQIVAQKNCKHCEKEFPIFQEDRDFYEKISPSIAGKVFSVPDPTLCPDCREQRRLAWKNELKLYKNTCHSCGENIVSRFHKESGYTNYCHECWASDSWYALSFGQDIDYEKSVFSQIGDILKKVPFQGSIGSFSNVQENAEYTNCTADIRNSYMVSESDFVQECFYGRLLRDSNNLFDCLAVSNSQYCYECIQSDALYNCHYVIFSSGCRDCSYIENCIGCMDCIGCIHLQNQQYCVLNKQYTKTEYIKFLESLNDKKEKEKFLGQVKDLFYKNRENKAIIIGSESCSGDLIINSKNIYEGHSIVGCEDARYVSEVNDSQDIMDVSAYGSKSYFMYEGVGVGRYSHHVYFCSTIGRGENLLYCVETKKSRDCFGCVNLKFAQYCIFNKQYTQKQYEKIVPKLIERMIEGGEWGEFFPAAMSPFGYNQTLASELFPLDDHEIKTLGFNPTDYTNPPIEVEKVIPAHALPDDIQEIPDDILNWAIECEVSGKPFRIIKQELEFYRKKNISVPRLHPDERRIARIKRL